MSNTCIHEKPWRPAAVEPPIRERAGEPGVGLGTGRETGVGGFDGVVGWC